ncbi:hypothetical protein F4806DRAFT_477131 [Annulohypoxylon nitens]|nr:hypothetical protein F4806DRAFT_477131 [Annulohypoxylon nitens]
MLAGSRLRYRPALILISIFLISLLYLCQFRSHNIESQEIVNPTSNDVVHPPPTIRRETEIVVASTSDEDASWVYRHFPQWNPKVYIVDDPLTLLTVPKNKGREAMVYLTYIIDNYDTLPDTTIFIHASRFQWHNDDPDYDIVPTLRNLRLPYVREAGYVNLRCVWVIGCPAEIRPFQDEDEGPRDQKHPSAKGVFRRAFEQLFPEIPVPELVAVSCCSQFAVSRDTIQRHSKERYLQFRDWLLKTPLDDGTSGRVMEFSWHSKSSSLQIFTLLPLHYSF